MPAQQVSIRLGTDGAAAVKRDLQDIGSTGRGAYDGIAASADRASSAASKVGASSDAAMAKWRQMAARAQQEVAQLEHDAANSSFFSNLGIGGSGKSAAESAAVFAEMGAGAKLSSQQMQVLAGSIHHAADALIAGAPPARVLTMELVKTAGGLEAAGEGGLAAVAGIAGAAATAAAAAAPFVLLGIAANQGAEDQARLSNALIVTGHYAAASAAELQAHADAVAKHADLSRASVETAFATLAASGSVASANMDAIGEAAGRIAALTHASVDKVAADLARIASDPAHAVENLQKQYHFLTQAEAEHISSLVNEGQQTRAINELFGALNASLASQTQHFGLLEGAIHGVSSALSELWADMKRVGETPAVSVQMAQVDAMLAAANRAKGNAAKEALFVSNTPDKTFAQVYAGLVKQSAELHAQNAKEQAATAAAAQHQQTIDAANELAQQLTDQKSNHQKALQEIAAYKANARRILSDNTSSPEARSNAQYALAHQAQLDKAINQKYAGGHPDKHAETLAREAAAMGVSADEALKVAQAYLQSSAAGEAAEAHRKAFTDATKKGTDADARYEAQLRLSATESAAQGAKAVAGLKNELEARQAAQAAVEDGSMTQEQANRQIQIELQLRPYLDAAQHADIATKAELAAIMKVMVKTQRDLNQATDDAALIQEKQAANDNIAQLQAQVEWLGKSRVEQELANAALRTQQQLRAHPDATGDQVLGLINANNAAAVAAAQADQAQYVQQTLQAQQDALRLSQAENLLLGATPAVHDRIIAQIKAANDAREHSVSLESAAGQQILKNAIAEQELARQAQRAQQVQSDFENLADQGLGRFADLIAQGKTDWGDWKNAATSAISDVIREAEQLALINPIMNKLFGTDRPTLADGKGGLAQLLGGGQSSAKEAAAQKLADQAAKEAATNAEKLAQETQYSAALTQSNLQLTTFNANITTLEASFGQLTSSAEQAAAALASVQGGGGGGGLGSFGFPSSDDFGGGSFDGGGWDFPGFATGTDDAPPGWHWVGEQGPELEKGQGGEQIMSNKRSLAYAATPWKHDSFGAAKSAMAAGDSSGNGGGVIIHNHLGVAARATASKDKKGNTVIRVDRDANKIAKNFIQSPDGARALKGVPNPVRQIG